ncbi:MAG: NTP transferase domain-containing protein, partial [Thermomicrobium sp.]
MVRIGAVVLAGGRSERFGRPKQLLPWESRTLIETVIDEVCRTPSLTAVVVVLRPEVAQHLGVQPGESLGCARVVLPETEGEGCAASYRSGLTALEGFRLDGVVIVLGDQPGLRVEMIERVVKIWSESGALLAGARYRDGE